jgi:hypothetical protein
MQRGYAWIGVELEEDGKSGTSVVVGSPVSSQRIESTTDLGRPPRRFASTSIENVQASHTDLTLPVLSDGRPDIGVGALRLKAKLTSIPRGGPTSRRAHHQRMSVAARVRQYYAISSCSRAICNRLTRYRSDQLTCYLRKPHND